MMNDALHIRFMLDTDTTSALQRGHPVVSVRVAAAGRGTVAPTVVTLS